jgi:hypothetical protein
MLGTDDPNSLTRACPAFKKYVAARKVQSIWRCKSGTSCLSRLCCGRTTSDDVEKQVCSIGYVAYTASRKIQAARLGKSLSSVFKCYVAARRIQAFWRGMSLHTLYTKYIAARKIQTIWCGTFCMVITRKHCRAGYSSLVARDIDSPQIRFFYGSSVNPNDVARVIKAQAVQGFLGDGINICRSLTNNEFCSAEHSDNVARKVDQNYGLPRLLERSKRCRVVLRSVGGIECIWGPVGFNLLGDAPRCV